MTRVTHRVAAVVAATSAFMGGAAVAGAATDPTIPATSVADSGVALDTKPLDSAADSGSVAGDPSTIATTALNQLFEQPFRFTADLDVSSDGMQMAGTDVMSGEINLSAGSSSPLAHVTVDLTSMIGPLLAGEEDLPPELANLDWTMETVVSYPNVYLRGGFFSLLGQAGPEFAELAALDTEWGMIDLAALSEEEMPAAIPPLTGLAPLVVGGASNAEMIGTRSVDGEELTGVRLSFSLDDVQDVATASASTPSLPEMGSDSDVPIEIWVDSTGAARELVLAVDPETFGDLASTAEQATAGMADGAFVLTVRVSDIGAADISIEEPVGAIDVTDAFLDLGGMPLGSS